MAQFRFRFAVAVAAFTSCALTGATPRHSSGAQAVQSAPAASSPSLRTGANLVLVDVVATEHGNPVPGIARDRFRIFENGKERPIVGFDEHRSEDASASKLAAQIKAQIASLPAHTFTNMPLYPATGAVNVLLLDGLNTPMADQAEARYQMIQYMKNVPPGTPIAIFTLTSHLRMIEGFTTDAAQLAAALKGKKASPSQSVVTEPQSTSAQMAIEQEMASLDSPSGPPSPEVLMAMQDFESDLTAFQTSLRVRMTLDAFDELARYLSGIPGRKNLIWFSGAFPITLDPDDSQTSYRNVEDYGELIRQTSDLLTDARVAVYPVDARGLFNMPSTGADYVPSPNVLRATRGGISRGSMGANINRDEMQAMNRANEEHGSMNTIAEETGGRAFYNTNDLKGAMAAAIHSGDSFYTLAFIPAGKLDGHYRKIKVDVEGARYELAYRKGYYADPSDKPSDRQPSVITPAQAALVHGVPDSTQILFAANILPATDPEFANLKMAKAAMGEMTASLKGPLHRYVVQFTVEPHSLAFDTMPGGVHEARVEFVLMAYKADGDRVNYEDRSFAINLNPDRYAWTMKYGVRGMMMLDLPPGQESLRAAVIDLNTQHTGSLEVPLTVAK